MNELGALPIVPFHRLPYKSWERRQEKKSRMLIEVVGPDSDTSSESSESLSTISSESTDSDASFQKYIKSLLPPTPIDGEDIPKYKFDDDEKPPVVVEKPTLFQIILDKFLNWRIRERERRMHYIIKHYEDIVKKYDEKQKQMIQEELAAQEKEVKRAAIRREKQLKRLSKKKVDNSAIIDQFTQTLERRDVEARSMAYYCYNLQRWAGDKDAEQRLKDEIAAREASIRNAKEKIAMEVKRRQERREEDDRIVEEDQQLTQDVLRIMRQSGYKEGVLVDESNDDYTDSFQRVQTLRRKNEKSKQMNKFASSESNLPGRKKRNKPEVTQVEELMDDKEQHPSTQSYSSWKDQQSGTSLAYAVVIDLHIKPGFDWNAGAIYGGDGKLRCVRPPKDSPFTVDLSKTRNCRTLKCHELGELGALSLSAELVRGACPSLETLEIRHGGLTCRSLGRLLNGIRLGNLNSIQELILNDNILRSRSVAYLKDSFEKGVLDNLKVLDLRDNEIIDEGCDIFMRLIIQGYLKNMTHLYLQRNGITDVGFSKIVRVLQSMQFTKCPMLERLGMEGNSISNLEKKKYHPLPACISV